MAVDAVPYPIDWQDRERIRFFAGYVLATADQMLLSGKITHKVAWGGDWSNFVDLYHFYLMV